MVGAGAVFGEVGGEEGRAQEGTQVVEEGALAGGADVVDVAKGHADEAVDGHVGGEAFGHGRGEFDALVGHGDGAEVDGVGADDALGGARVAVGDGPVEAAAVDEGRRGVRVVDFLVAGPLRRR